MFLLLLPSSASTCMQHSRILRNGLLEIPCIPPGKCQFQRMHPTSIMLRAPQIVIAMRILKSRLRLMGERAEMDEARIFSSFVLGLWAYGPGKHTMELNESASLFHRLTRAHLWCCRRSYLCIYTVCLSVYLSVDLSDHTDTARGQ